MESQQNILFDNLINAGKENALLKEQVEEGSKDLEALKKDQSTYKVEKEGLFGKLKMVHTELESSTSTIKRMNTGSMKLDEIFGSQKIDLSKTGLGYI